MRKNSIALILLVFVPYCLIALHKSPDEVLLAIHFQYEKPMKKARKIEVRFETIMRDSLADSPVLKGSLLYNDRLLNYKIWDYEYYNDSTALLYVNHRTKIVALQPNPEGIVGKGFAILTKIEPDTVIGNEKISTELSDDFTLKMSRQAVATGDSIYYIYKYDEQFKLKYIEYSYSLNEAAISTRIDLLQESVIEADSLLTPDDFLEKYKKNDILTGKYSGYEFVNNKD
jgi:hypothetical protein